MNTPEARDLRMGRAGGKLRTEVLLGLSPVVDAGRLTLIAGCGKSILLSIRSGGGKQRVASARALAGRPQPLFADEPASAPDAASGQVAIDTWYRIARTRGATVRCVSHDPHLVTHADRAPEMADGVILGDHRVPLAVGAQEDEAVS